MRVGIIGLGLIGGSLAKALRARGCAKYITSFGRNEAALKLALADGVIDYYSLVVDESFADLDYVFICTPVSEIVSFAKKLLPFLAERTVVTDVGSTKAKVCAEMESLPLKFIGGHPMAGSEKTGCTASRADLFEGTRYILTPGKNIPGEDVDAFGELVKKLGAEPVIMPPEIHDSVAAAVSHAPHVAASALVRAAKFLDTRPDERYTQKLAATGFKDTTRIAGGSPEMWTAICLSNRKHIMDAINALHQELATFMVFLAGENEAALLKYFKEAKEYRDGFE